MLAPEVLAPAGGWPQAKAAVENGADAIYFGLKHFNARARAANFAVEELPELMSMLHERGVQGFVTFNTLLFDEELSKAEAALRAIIDAGVDSLIVQDLGVVRLIRQISPDVPIHGSTQMTITSAQGAELVRQLGVERVVLARELSTTEIATIASQTDIELEVFVHGALCVSYSGQCFSSEAWGGRSANRGQCAQACRMPYDMILDGQPHDLGDKRYLLSPQDLMGVEQVEALMAAGVSCFKIEGRLKGPEYVALTTRTYRNAIDTVLAGRKVTLAASERRDLETVFSRGLTPGFLDGVKHQVLVEGRSPRHRGVRLGTVREVTRAGVLLNLEAPLKRGDGVVFDAGRPQEREEGGKVYEIFVGRTSPKEALSGVLAELRFGPGLQLHNIQPGDIVWKNRDEALEARLKASFDKPFARRTPVDALVSGAEGEPLNLTLRDDDGFEATATTTIALQPAQRRGLDETGLRKFIGRLGQTPFDLRQVSNLLDEDLFMPTSALNQVRRQATQALIEARRQSRQNTLNEDGALPGLLGRLQQGQVSQTPQTDNTQTTPRLTLLCRTPEQINAALELPEVDTVYIDFLEIKGLKESIRQVQATGRKAIAVAPRILKVKEERIWRFLLNLKADGILVRSLGLLQTLNAMAKAGTEEIPPLLADFSLNATNALSVDFLRRFGLSVITPGHDLNAHQLCQLAQQVGAQDLELIIHHHLPIFHTEHCVFCRFLSDGNSFRDCGRPCEEHEVKLRDHRGKEHAVLADMGCRNTVFNATPQSGAKHLPEFLNAGFRRFRLELVDLPAEDVAPLVRKYLQGIQGDLNVPQLWRWLSNDTDQGVTLGSLVVRAERQTFKPTAR